MVAQQVALERSYSATENPATQGLHHGNKASPVDTSFG